jgi:hypothetical protein
MPQSAAAVVDLEEFRRRREARRSPPARPAVPPQATVAMPVWMCWVPVWVVR